MRFAEASNRLPVEFPHLVIYFASHSVVYDFDALKPRTFTNIYWLTKRRVNNTGMSSKTSKKNTHSVWQIDCIDNEQGARLEGNEHRKQTATHKGRMASVLLIFIWKLSMRERRIRVSGEVPRQCCCLEM